MAVLRNLTTAPGIDANSFAPPSISRGLVKPRRSATAAQAKIERQITTEKPDLAALLITAIDQIIEVLSPQPKKGPPASKPFSDTPVPHG